MILSRSRPDEALVQSIEKMHIAGLLAGFAAHGCTHEWAAAKRLTNTAADNTTRWSLPLPSIDRVEVTLLPPVTGRRRWTGWSWRPSSGTTWLWQRQIPHRASATVFDSTTARLSGRRNPWCSRAAPADAPQWCRSSPLTGASVATARFRGLKP